MELQPEFLQQQDLVEEIKEISGYEFRNPGLLEQAFTHRSYLNQRNTMTASYDRLEYMGDALINFFVAKWHFIMYPDLSSGQLTSLRSSNIDNEKLARVALKHKLHRFLHHKRPCLPEKIIEFEEAIVDYPIHSWGLIEAPKALADIVESLVGAIYVDSNYSIDTTCKIVENLLQPMITPSTLSTNPVTKLNEICQKNNLQIKKRDLWRETGEFGYMLDGEFVGKAKYTPKRHIAKNKAAHEAYHKVLSKLRLQNTGKNQQ